MGKKRARSARESFADGCARKLALVRFEIISG